MKKERKDRERSGKDVTESDDEVDRKDREFSSRKQKKTEEDSARAEDNLRISLHILMLFYLVSHVEI